jgi:hypothetical protein
MKLESIAEKLEIAGVGARGDKVFVNHMPPMITVGVLLREPFGGTMIDPELPNFRKTSFQLIVRSNNDMAAALALMNQALAGIVTETEQNYPQGMFVKYVRQRHEPLRFPITPGNALELLVNIDVCYVLV